MKVPKGIYKAKTKSPNNTWVRGHYIHNSRKDKIEKGLEHNIQLHTSSEIILPINIETLCHYTEITDRNDNFLCENDIVNFFGYIGIVTYSNGCFGIAFQDIIDWDELEQNIFKETGVHNPMHACMNDNFISFWEIVSNFDYEENNIPSICILGNIFDNPELLIKQNKYKNIKEFLEYE